MNLYKIIPENGSVLCDNVIPSKQESDLNGVFCSRDNLPVFKIIDIADNIHTDFNIGDNIICSSSGTEIKNGDKIQYLIKLENIIGKILD